MGISTHFQQTLSPHEELYLQQNLTSWSLYSNKNNSTIIHLLLLLPFLSSCVAFCASCHQALLCFSIMSVHNCLCFSITSYPHHGSHVKMLQHTSHVSYLVSNKFPYIIIIIHNYIAYMTSYLVSNIFAMYPKVIMQRLWVVHLNSLLMAWRWILQLII